MANFDRFLQKTFSATQHEQHEHEVVIKVYKVIFIIFHSLFRMFYFVFFGSFILCFSAISFYIFRLFCFAFFEYCVFYQYSSPQYLASTLSIFALPTGFAVWISTG